MGARRLASVALYGAWLCAAACAPTPERPAPPVPSELAELEPEVAALIEGKLAELRAAPDAPAAWFELGMVYEANALGELGAACYLQVVEEQPKHAKAWYRLGLVRASLGDGSEALAAWTRAAELAPGEPFTQWRLGLALLDAGRLPEARSRFEAALSLEPGSVPARAGLARVLLQQDEARPALELLEGLVVERPEDPRLRQRRDAARRRLGLPVTSSTSAASAPEVWPDPWASEAGRYWVGFGADLARGETALRDGRPAEALRHLEPHREARADDAIFLVTLGTALARAGRADEGLVLLREAAALDPRRARVHVELAEVLHRAGRLDEALAEADLACRLAPSSGSAHAVRGVVLRLRGRKEASREAFERAVRFDPESVRTRRLLASLQLETRRLAEALASYTEVVERAPEDEKGWLGLGMARLELGAHAEAERALREAERLGPRGQWEVHVVLAELQRRRAAAARP